MSGLPAIRLRVKILAVELDRIGWMADSFGPTMELVVDEDDYGPVLRVPREGGDDAKEPAPSPGEGSQRKKMGVQ